MRLTKYTHACVRLEHDDGALVIDPGSFSERESLTGAGAVLITHEHMDHLDEQALADHPSIEVYTNPDVAKRLVGLAGTVHEVLPGDEFTAAGFRVRVYGGLHALIHPDVPRLANVGFLVEGIYHPGDSFEVPDTEVDRLLVPVSAPWLKLAEAVDFVRAVRPRLAHPIHDVLLSDVGRQFTDRLMTNLSDTEYVRLAAGDSVTVG
jgi:L-ascorbate metabolism protein UlaG (beta-lactamase superfamily)